MAIEHPDQSVDDDNTEKFDSEPKDSWYFVDESIKDRLSGAEGPSFSVASLFASSANYVPEDFPPSDDKDEYKWAGPTGASLWKKESLFILDDEDSRLINSRNFFSEGRQDVNSAAFAKTRREIRIIVQNKFKRAERNQEKFRKNPQPQYFNRKRNFKKQKT